MGDRLFDEIARVLAEPMPRSRALRLAGAAVVAAAVPGLRPRRARAGTLAGVPCTAPGICPPGKPACGITFTNSAGFQSCKLGCCLDGAARAVCCKGQPAGASEPSAWCCPKGSRCGQFTATSPACIAGCPRGTTTCGKQCCPKGQVCYRGQCRKACPPKTVKCGKTCCTAKQTCRNGKCCNKCGEGGKCCKPATEVCCSGKGEGAACCNKKTEACCMLGPADNLQWKCCAKPNKCLRQFPRTPGGHTASSPRVCCPPARQVPDGPGPGARLTGCCAPGQVSLGGKLVVGPGIQGNCCDAGRTCGSGADLTCCSPGQTCVGGRCVSG